ncbi:pickpocket protein 28 [Anabrus simplex]|uniref:pickpocket protein 28 n=1 Tax=Anabrus simplex TaxID=316456 RepID=UPI0035A2B413
MQQQMRAAFGSETSKEDRCNCLQSCTELQYNSDLNHSPLNKMTVYFESLPENETRVAGLTVIFKQSHFIGNRRSELYGSMDFLANCGGLLGLGLGCSMLSLLEVIYWLCLRVWCRKTTGVKAGSNQSEYLCKE